MHWSKLTCLYILKQVSYVKNTDFNRKIIEERLEASNAYKEKERQAWGCMSVSLAIQEAEAGGSSGLLVCKYVKPYLKT